MNPEEFNSPFRGLREKKKKGKHLLSHRYNLLPLLCSHPGGVQRELVVKDLPGTKVEKDVVLQNPFIVFFDNYGYLVDT
ncbi:hypothetical protein AB669_17075 [Pedobacter sp. BMA]|nr:hypothetical protein AB669_17075 [Pedobacter sp. BMA]